MSTCQFLSEVSPATYFGVDHETLYLLHSPVLTSISIAHLTSSGGQTRSGGKLVSGECGQSPPGYHTAMAGLLLVCSHMIKGQFNPTPKSYNNTVRLNTVLLLIFAAPTNTKIPKIPKYQKYQKHKPSWTNVAPWCY